MNKDGKSIENNIPKRARVSANLIVREDHAQEIPLTSRRLDSLAALIEGNSVCSAVTFRNNKIYIATNRMYLKSGDTNESGRLITEVMSYYGGPLCQDSFLNNLRYNISPCC